jgi:hypothetical protein
VVIASYNDHCSAPFSRALVGSHHQSLLGRGNRHCYGINYTHSPPVARSDGLPLCRERGGEGAAHPATQHEARGRTGTAPETGKGVHYAVLLRRETLSPNCWLNAVAVSV